MRKNHVLNIKIQTKKLFLESSLIITVFAGNNAAVKNCQQYFKRKLLQTGPYSISLQADSWRQMLRSDASSAVSQNL